MKKWYFCCALVIATILAGPSLARTISALKTNIDDFTDEATHMLLFSSDDHTGSSDGVTLGTHCGNNTFHILATIGVQYHIGKVTEVTYRIDTSPPVTETWSWLSGSSAAWNNDMSLARTILQASKFVIRFNGDTARYDFTSHKVKIKEFWELCKSFGPA